MYAVGAEASLLPVTGLFPLNRGQLSQPEPARSKDQDLYGCSNHGAETLTPGHCFARATRSATERTPDLSTRTSIRQRDTDANSAMHGGSPFLVTTSPRR
jgi:hypothetical protein